MDLFQLFQQYHLLAVVVEQLILVLHQQIKAKLVVQVVAVEEMAIQEIVQVQEILLQQPLLKEIMVELQQQQVGVAVAVAVELLQSELVEVVLVVLVVK
jgi:hypothetical protein